MQIEKNDDFNHVYILFSFAVGPELYHLSVDFSFVVL